MACTHCKQLRLQPWQSHATHPWPQSFACTAWPTSYLRLHGKCGYSEWAPLHLVFLQQRPWDLFNHLLRVNQGQRFRGFTRRQRQPSVAREHAPQLRGAGKHGESPHHTFELALEEGLRSRQKHNHSLNSTFAHENVCHGLCCFKYIWRSNQGAAPWYLKSRFHSVQQSPGAG